MSNEQEFTPIQTQSGAQPSVFSQEDVNYNLAEARNFIRRPLNPRWIQQRKQGNTMLSYIGGHVVTHLLNNAFNYQWSFEILSKEIVPSLPKQRFTGYGRDRKAATDKEGNFIFDPQPPVIEVLGRLTVPGLGFREQYGSKIIIGGATEQEHATKAAATDALKKCASLFGIGLQLYGDADGLMNMDEQPHEDEAYLQVQDMVAPQQSQHAQEQSQEQQAKPAPPPEEHSSIEQPAEQSPRQTAFGFDKADTNRLIELKQLFGKKFGQDGPIQNDQLNPFMKELTGDDEATYRLIKPSNIKEVIQFLERKLEEA